MWEPPAAPFLSLAGERCDPTVIDVAQTTRGAVSSPTASSSPLWQEVMLDEGDDMYYFCVDTGESIWEVPDFYVALDGML